MDRSGCDITCVTGVVGGQAARRCTLARRSRSVTMPIGAPSPPTTATASTPWWVMSRATSATDASGAQVSGAPFTRSAIPRTKRAISPRSSPAGPLASVRRCRATTDCGTSKQRLRSVTTAEQAAGSPGVPGSRTSPGRQVVENLLALHVDSGDLDGPGLEDAVPVGSGLTFRDELEPRRIHLDARRVERARPSRPDPGGRSRGYERAAHCDQPTSTG